MQIRDRLEGLEYIESELLALQVLDFMYTGKITLSAANIAEVLRLADFLCVTELTSECVKYMSSVNLGTPELCLLFLQLVETFRLSLNSESLIARVHQSVSKRLPQIFGVIGSVDDLPTLIVRQLLAEPEIGSVPESKICSAICQLAAKRPDDVTVLDLLHRVEFDYLGSAFVHQNLLKNTKITEWLDQRRPEVLAALREQVSRQTMDATIDVIVCGRRIVPVPGTSISPACLLLYVIQQDIWIGVKNPASLSSETNPEPQAPMPCNDSLSGRECAEASPPMRMRDWLEGLECTVTEGHWLYALCILERGNAVTRHFCRLNLSTGAYVWQKLQSPSVVKSQCRMVLLVDSIHAVDRSGIVERYSSSNDTWTVVCGNGCPWISHFMQTTLYILPMVFGVSRQLFALRVDTFGDQTFHMSRNSCNVALFILRHGQTEWKLKGRSEITLNYLLYSSTSSVEPRADNFLEYIVTPAAVRLLDEVSRERACTNFLGSDWKSIVTLQNIQPRPDFVGEKIHGSLTHGTRVYGSCIGTAHFVIYDLTRRRYKAVCRPPETPTSVMCHARLNRSSVARLVGVRKRLSGVSDRAEKAESSGEASGSQEQGQSPSAASSVSS